MHCAARKGSSLSHGTFAGLGANQRKKVDPYLRDGKGLFRFRQETQLPHRHSQVMGPSGHRF